MKCPYNGFANCIVEQCPSCNCKQTIAKVVYGIYPHYWGVEKAIERGMAWECDKKTYEFISCKLIDNNVQPIPPKEETVNNITNTKVNVSHSIF